MVGRSSTASVRGGGEEEWEVWGGSECGAGGSPDVEHESEDDDGDLHVQEEVREEGVERLSFEKLDDCNYAEQTEGLLFPALHLAQVWTRPPLRPLWLIWSRSSIVRAREARKWRLGSRSVS